MHIMPKFSIKIKTILSNKLMTRSFKVIAEVLRECSISIAGSWNWQGVRHQRCC